MKNDIDICCEVLFGSNSIHYDPDDLGINDFILKDIINKFSFGLRTRPVFLNDFCKILNANYTKRGQIYGYLPGDFIDARWKYDDDLKAFRVVFHNLKDVYQTLPD